MSAGHMAALILWHSKNTPIATLKYSRRAVKANTTSYDKGTFPITDSFISIMISESRIGLSMKNLTLAKV